MDIQNDKFPQGRVIRPSGSIDLNTAEQLKSVLIEALEDGLVVLDLSNVAFIDSFGIGTLIGLTKTPFYNGFFRISGAKDAVMKTFKMARLDRILALYNDVNAAVKEPTPKRIAIIEPDIVTRSTIESVLESYDYTVSGSADLESIAPGTPNLFIITRDVVVADLEESVNPPKKSALAPDREKVPMPPTLAIIEADSVAPLKSDQVLHKPFDPYELLGHVRVLLGENIGKGALVLSCISDPDVADEIETVVTAHDYAFENHNLFKAFFTAMVQKTWACYIINKNISGMSIDKVIESIRATEKDAPTKTPIIIIGTPESQEDVIKLIKLGISDIIGLPLSPEILLGKLAKNIQ